MLNVHHLELFYYVARAGGITAALREIPYGIQQPAVSLQMSQLEDSVGAQLFIRRPFSLTPAGREIYEFVTPFFSGLPQLAARLRGQAAQQLCLAASGMVMRDHFPWILREMRRRIPDLKLTLRDTGALGPAPLLRAHEADIVLGLHHPEENAGLHFERMMTLEMLLLVQSSSPFRNAGQVLREAARGELPLISSMAPDELRTRFQAELQRRGQVWKVSFELPGLDVIEAYVAQGFGVGLSIAAPGHALPRKVRALKLTGFPQVHYGAFWLDRLSNPALVCLDVVRERARGLK
jgi:DNA-binding transcriptional LysR family regulator